MKRSSRRAVRASRRPRQPQRPKQGGFPASRSACVTVERLCARVGGLPPAMDLTVARAAPPPLSLGVFHVKRSPRTIGGLSRAQRSPGAAVPGAPAAQRVHVKTRPGRVGTWCRVRRAIRSSRAAGRRIGVFHVKRSSPAGSAGLGTASGHTTLAHAGRGRASPLSEFQLETPAGRVGGLPSRQARSTAELGGFPDRSRLCVFT